MKRNFILCSLLAVCFAFSGALYGQEKATIVGTVTDSTGSVIPNAKVTVTDEGTQAIRTVQANAQGYYVIPALRPSTYDLTTTAQGFASYGMAPSEFAAFFRRQYDAFVATVRENNVRFD